MKVEFIFKENGEHLYADITYLNIFFSGTQDSVKMF